MMLEKFSPICKRNDFKLFPFKLDWLTEQRQIIRSETISASLDKIKLV